MVDTDLIIVGSGFAGLWAAITAREAGVERVLLVDKAAIALSSQSKLSAGATIYCLPEDDPDLWLRDVAEAQGFLCHQDMEFLAVNTGSPQYGFEGTGLILRRGGRLLNANGEAFLSRYHPDADAAEIGVIVQAMAREVEQGHGPPFHLDLRHTQRRWLRFLLSRAASLPRLTLEKLSAAGIDIFATPQEWVPAVQSLRGGIRTDIDGRSDVPGLFAAGLAQAFDPGLFNGWSSMRAMWGGERAGRAAAVFVAAVGAASPHREEVAAAQHRAVAPLSRASGPAADDAVAALHRAIFPYDVCILKARDRLQAALRTVTALAETPLRAADPHELAKAHETNNMLRTAELFLRASLRRTESRGDHYREDFPVPDNDRWLQWVTLRHGLAGTPVTALEPVPFDHYPLQPGTAR